MREEGEGGYASEASLRRTKGSLTRLFIYRYFALVVLSLS